MLLAVDASHLPAVAVVDDDGRVVWERAGEDPRSHAEAIGPFLAAALDAASRDRVDAVVVGTGPGPFTGLRVGIAAGRAVADALDVPVLPVLSHDGIALAALAAGRAGGFVVVTDAKRRERYWTAYAGADADGLPVREAGPDVAAPDLLPALPHETGPLSPSALALVALLRRRAGRPADPDEPRYLRSPDVTPARSRA